MSAADARLDVVTCGEAMVLFTADSPGPLAEVDRFSRRLAGAETNVAIGLSRLGLRVGWISRLGADAFGAFVRRSVAREGVDCSHVAVDAARSTGFMLKSLSLDGRDPDIEYHRRGSAASALDVADVDITWLARARHLHVTGILPALGPGPLALTRRLMDVARREGLSISFDPNLRPRLWASPQQMADTLNSLATQARWVLPGLAEGRQLTGLQQPADIADFYLSKGVEAVVIKLGDQGAYLRTADGDAVQVPGVNVPRVVDTVGAGDGFAAGLISARLEGHGWRDAVSRANWVGAQAIQVVGDMEGLPFKSQLPASLR